jgi:sporulation protein YlmC with PRC-barrel domain
VNSRPGETLLAARQLIGARVETSDGRTLGHVIDLEVDPERNFRVSAVELGRFGWLDRWRATRSLAHDRLGGKLRVVAWRDIERYEQGTLVCKTGTKVQEALAGEDESEPKPDRTPSGG